MFPQKNEYHGNKTSMIFMLNKYSCDFVVWLSFSKSNLRSFVGDYVKYWNMKGAVQKKNNAVIKS